MLYLMTSGTYSDYGVGELIEGPEGLTSQDFKNYKAESNALYRAASAELAARREAWLVSQGWTNGWRSLHLGLKGIGTETGARLWRECLNVCGEIPP